MLRTVRRWFYDRGFVEVQTPVLTRAPIPEPTIETFCLTAAGPSEASSPRRHDLYLVPSPEIYMKRLLSAGMDRIFQITPVFRKEENGSQHLPEFTMLEWYRAHADYAKLMDDCESLLQAAAVAAGHKDRIPLADGGFCHISVPFPRLTVNDAFEKYAGWRPGATPDPDKFDIDMVEKVEPALARERPVFLMDYPASMASLARLKPSNPDVAERVELFAGGMEIANGFSELNDAEEQRRRFVHQLELRKKLGLHPYPMPEEFLRALESMPPSAGMALGIDRLMMLLFGSSHIREVVAFVP